MAGLGLLLDILGRARCERGQGDFEVIRAVGGKVVARDMVNAKIGSIADGGTIGTGGVSIAVTGMGNGIGITEIIAGKQAVTVVCLEPDFDIAIGIEDADENRCANCQIGVGQFGFEIGENPVADIFRTKPGKGRNPAGEIVEIAGNRGIGQQGITRCPNPDQGDGGKQFCAQRKLQIINFATGPAKPDRCSKPAEQAGFRTTTPNHSTMTAR